MAGDLFHRPLDELVHAPLQPLGGKGRGNSYGEEALIQGEAYRAPEPCLIAGSGYLELELAQGRLPYLFSACLQGVLAL